MSKVDKLVRKLDTALSVFEDNVVALCLGVMTAVCFLGVVNRFFLKHALPWSEELSRYLGIWAAMVGASAGVRKGAHIGVEAFVALVSKRFRPYVDVLTYVCSLVFCVALSVIGFRLTRQLIQTGQLSPAMRVPMAYAYAAVPLGSTLMAVRYTMKLVHTIGGLMKNAFARE